MLRCMIARPHQACWLASEAAKHRKMADAAADTMQRNPIFWHRSDYV
jgi:hypothetical protein